MAEPRWSAPMCGPFSISCRPSRARAFTRPMLALFRLLPDFRAGTGGLPLGELAVDRKFKCPARRERSAAAVRCACGIASLARWWCSTMAAASASATVPPMRRWRRRWPACSICRSYSVEYRLAPGGAGPPRPTMPRRQRAGLRRTVPSTGLILAGDSAGGNLALVTALALRDAPAAVPVLGQAAALPGCRYADRLSAAR